MNSFPAVAARSKPVRPLSLHTLYLANHDGAPFSRAERGVVATAVAARFPGFRLSDTLGSFGGRPVATLLVDVAADDTPRVMALARDLGMALGQGKVGLAVGGQYQNISA
jgi:hypothetical protein